MALQSTEGIMLSLEDPIGILWEALTKTVPVL